MKHFHMLMAVLAIGLFCYQSYIALTTDKPQRKLHIVISHTIYLIMIVTGLIMVKPLISIEDLPLQWVLAKAILLIAVISSSMKAFRENAEITQRKMGIIISVIGFIGIVTLAFVQPDNWL